jgi:uncharacterized membrane protein
LGPRGGRRLGPLALGVLVVNLATLALLGLVAGILALGPLHGGYAIVALRVASGRSVRLQDFFDGFEGTRRIFPLMAVWLVIVGLALVGALFLVLPGVYLAVAGVYGPLLVVDRGMPAWEAYKTSMRAVSEQLGAHLVLLVALGLVNFVALLPLGFGLLLTLPLTIVAVGLAYGRTFGFAGGVDRIGH